jgi:hypothetical protein
MTIQAGGKQHQEQCAINGGAGHRLINCWVGLHRVLGYIAVFIRGVHKNTIKMEKCIYSIKTPAASK